MIKKFSVFVLVSIAVGALFLSYMYFIGVPKTKARNFYNLAVQAEKDGNKSKELEYLHQAADYWPEQYILQKISDLQN